MTQDARHFAYTSDSSVPAFVYHTEGQVNNTGTYYGGDGCVKIAHNLPFVPLVVGYWSSQSDFSNSHDISYGSAAQESGAAMTVLADSNYLYVNTSAESQVMFHFRIYAYAPNDYSGEVTPITDESTFHFSTDYVYLKVAQEGRVSPNGAVKIDIPINLGYLPIYRVWRTNSMLFKDGNSQVTVKGLGSVSSFVDYSISNPLEDVIKDGQLTISWGDDSPSGDDYAYYQIYSNEA